MTTKTYAHFIHRLASWRVGQLDWNWGTKTELKRRSPKVIHMPKERLAKACE